MKSDATSADETPRHVLLLCRWTNHGPLPLSVHESLEGALRRVEQEVGSASGWDVTLHNDEEIAPSPSWWVRRGVDQMWRIIYRLSVLP